MRDYSLGGYGDHSTRSAAVKFVGGNVQVVEKRCQKGDEAFKSYVEYFSYFFRREFLVRRMFEVLNSENKPEHVGFRKACNTLYAVYSRQTKWVVEDNLIEHLYGHDFTHLDIDRTTAFFAWLGVCKPLRADWTPEPRVVVAESKITNDVAPKETMKNTQPKLPQSTEEKLLQCSLAYVNADLQKAMAARDIPSIKMLMRERKTIPSR